MSLRDDLARKLVIIFIQSLPSGTELKFGGDPVPTDPDQFPKADIISFLPLADECIRQMEWARRHTITPGWTMEIGGEIPRKIVLNQMDELTLAPEDWKAEETR